MEENNNGIDYKNYYYCKYKRNLPLRQEVQEEKTSYVQNPNHIIQYDKYERRNTQKNISKRYNEKKSNKKPYNKAKWSYIFVIIVLFITICAMVVVDYLGYEKLKSRPTWISGSNKVYYAIEMNSFSDYDSAYVFADALRKQGGGGFILKEDSYYKVLAAMYKTETDAKTICERLILNENMARVYYFTIPKVEFNNYEIRDREIILNVMEYYNVIYECLYSVSNDLDKEMINNESAINKIKLLKEKIVSTKQQLDNNLASTEINTQIIKIKAELVSAIAILDNLTNNRLARPNLLCDIRYSYILVVHNYINLVNSL